MAEPQVSSDATTTAVAEDAGSSVKEEMLMFRVVYAKKTTKIEYPLSGTIGALKKVIQEKCGCPAGTQKLMYKGLVAGPDKPDLDTVLLKDTKIVRNAKVLVVGATADQIMDVAAVASKAEEAGGVLPDVSKAKAEKWCDMKEHKQVISRGKPEDAAFAYRPGQDPLPEGYITGYSATGKIRLTIKLAEGVIVVGTNERTRKIPIQSIRSITSQPITNHEEYHILCVQAGPTERSNIYVYWFPAQYTSSLKGMVGMY